MRRRAMVAIMFWISTMLLGQQPLIQSVQTALDPSDGPPQNVRITVLSGHVIPRNAVLQISLRTISSDGNSKPIDSPAASPLRDNPTGLSFLVPVSKLVGADQLAYQISLKIADQSQCTPELRLALAPIAAFQDLAQQELQLQQQLTLVRQQRDAALIAGLEGLPETPVFVAKRFKASDAETSVLVQFTTHKPGQVHAKLMHSGDDALVDEHTETQPTVNHTFSFANAVAGQAYYIVAAIFDPKSRKDVTSKTISGTGDPQLKFTMGQPGSKPHVSNLTRSQITSNSVRFAFDIDSAAALQVTCIHLPNPDVPSQQEKISTPVAFKVDSFGLPFGDGVSGHKEYSCDKLDSEQTYIAQIEAVNDFGQPLQGPAAVQGRTLTKLEFDGPIALTFVPGGLTVAWKAKAPGATGMMIFQLPGQKPVSFPVPSDGSAFSTTFSLDKLAAAFPVDPNTQTVQIPPTITAQMTDGCDTIDRSFVFSANLPRTKASAQKEAQITNAVSDSLTRIADGIQNPSAKNKFSWQDLVKTGLGAIIKLI